MDRDTGPAGQREPMTLLVGPAELEARRNATNGSLAPLARSLADDLRIVQRRPLFVPPEKALLSREGGRCARDGAMLEFDPFDPASHRCPTCGSVYAGELHYRFWIYWYQLWLAERAVHASLLGALGVDDSFVDFADAVLSAYVDSYVDYPNRDNVLGPSRLFFSTYVESIWLLQICIAADLLDRTRPALTGRVRDRIIEPGRAIIARFDEGSSNRQVWNDAALLAAARVLGDQHGAEQAVVGPSGIAFHLANGLLADGTWYEGENYHLFAHRGLWYGVTMADRAGVAIDSALLERFRRGFVAPFLTALPDLTFPSRRDSQYAVSLRQWRIAEHVELGLAMAEDPQLIGALARLYRDDVPRRDPNRWRSSADVERNGPASALTRADLSWRGLLCARAELPPLVPVAPQSALLEAQGLAVFRRSEGRTYVALDYGHSGGGHGHPDRLNLLLVDGDHRWLDDYGTGSYVDPSLHWYRSSLAHNAPSFNGTSQKPIAGLLRGYHEADDVGWITASVKGLEPQLVVSRELVVMPDYLIDTVTWMPHPGDEPFDPRTNADLTFTLPLHADITLDSGVDDLRGATLAGGTALEDGYAFVHDAAVQHATAAAVVHGVARAGDGDRLDLWARAAVPRRTEWWRAVAPGPPGSGERAFRVIRVAAPAGILTMVWSWAGAIRSVRFDRGVEVVFHTGATHRHDTPPRQPVPGARGHESRRSEPSRRIEMELADGRKTSLALSAPTIPTPPAASLLPVHAEKSRVVRLAPGASWRTVLGEAEYRGSEQTWHEASSPTAIVSLVRQHEDLHIDVDVPVSDRTFVRRDAVNTLDNEHPDINGDGIQLYVETPNGFAGRVLVPELGGSSVRIRAIDGWDAPLPLSARWIATPAGYRMEITVPAHEVYALDLIVNEKPVGRDRRRGQLVLSGAAHEFVYLRGDRHDRSRLIRLSFPHA